jgi:hypothetical protein
MNQLPSFVEIIQLMLAPGLMISACGLLLLGMNNKYSFVVNRIRLLNDERRKILHKMDDKDFNYHENVRLASILKQLDALVYRVMLVRNAVLSYTVAVALFVLTSLSIGAEEIFNISRLNTLITILFSFGMLSVLSGVIFAAYETYKGYEIVKFEVAAEE